MKIVEKGLTGSSLKWIAIVTMFIDHTGAAILTRVLLNSPYNQGILEVFNHKEAYTILYYIMRATRTIGRLAFPIFCFLLVEGFLRTGNRRKYVLRMFLFALITELPFDLVFSARLADGGYQNVMFTLLIGLLVMCVCSELENRFASKRNWLIIGCVLSTGAGMLLAHLLQTDYSYKGVFSILLLYFFRKDRMTQLLAGALSFVWEAYAMLSFLMLAKYNGQRGKQRKNFFYLFYPVHLLFIYVICIFLGIEGIAVT